MLELRGKDTYEFYTFGVLIWGNLVEIYMEFNEESKEHQLYLVDVLNLPSTPKYYYKVDEVLEDFSLNCLFVVSL